MPVVDRVVMMMEMDINRSQRENIFGTRRIKLQAGLSSDHYFHLRCVLTTARRIMPLASERDFSFVPSFSFSARLEASSFPVLLLLPALPFDLQQTSSRGIQ